MCDKIPVQRVRKHGKNNYYYVNEVRCLMTGEMQSSYACKKCDHCRIYMSSVVKCSYQYDKERAERQIAITD